MSWRFANKLFLIAASFMTVFAVRAYLERRDLWRESGRIFMMGWNAHNFNDVLNAAEDDDIGGVVIFAGAASNAAELKTKIAQLRAASKAPLIFAVDAEGGMADRLGDLAGYGPTASAWVLGHRRDLTMTEVEAAKIALALKTLDIDLDLAPVVDLAVNPKSPAIALRQRAFSNDAKVVSAHAGRFLQTLTREGVRGTLKHFPGHGSATQDSHTALPDITATWSAKELEPYRKLLPQAGAVMTAHLLNTKWDPTFPTSLSVHAIHDILRGELGYRGLVITDDLQMGAVAQRWDQATLLRQALNAGNDLLLYAQQYRREDMKHLHKLLLDEISSGRVSRERLEAAVQNVDAFSARAALRP